MEFGLRCNIIVYSHAKRSAAAYVRSLAAEGSGGGRRGSVLGGGRPVAGLERAGEALGRTAAVCDRMMEVLEMECAAADLARPVEPDRVAALVPGGTRCLLPCIVLVSLATL